MADITIKAVKRGTNPPVIREGRFDEDGHICFDFDEQGDDEQVWDLTYIDDDNECTATTTYTVRANDYYFKVYPSGTFHDGGYILRTFDDASSYTYIRVDSTNNGEPQPFAITSTVPSDVECVIDDTYQNIKLRDNGNNATSFVIKAKQNGSNSTGSAIVHRYYFQHDYPTDGVSYDDMGENLDIYYPWESKFDDGSYVTFQFSDPSIGDGSFYNAEIVQDPNDPTPNKKVIHVYVEGLKRFVYGEADLKLIQTHVNGDSSYSGKEGHLRIKRGNIGGDYRFCIDRTDNSTVVSANGVASEDREVCANNTGTTNPFFGAKRTYDVWLTDDRMAMDLEWYFEIGQMSMSAVTDLHFGTVNEPQARFDVDYTFEIEHPDDPTPENPNIYKGLLRIGTDGDVEIKQGTIVCRVPFMTPYFACSFNLLTGDGRIIPFFLTFEYNGQFPPI